MIRWTDLIGFAGFILVLLSTQLLFPGSGDSMNWPHMLGGLALWFAGFASVVGSILLHFSRAGSPPKVKSPDRR
jgi:hypothetical protein